MSPVEPVDKLPTVCPDIFGRDSVKCTEKPGLEVGNQEMDFWERGISNLWSRLDVDLRPIAELSKLFISDPAIRDDGASSGDTSLDKVRKSVTISRPDYLKPRRAADLDCFSLVMPFESLDCDDQPSASVPKTPTLTAATRLPPSDLGLINFHLTPAKWVLVTLI